MQRSRRRVVVGRLENMTRAASLCGGLPNKINFEFHLHSHVACKYGANLKLVDLYFTAAATAKTTCNRPPYDKIDTRLLVRLSIPSANNTCPPPIIRKTPGDGVGYRTSFCFVEQQNQPTTPTESKVFEGNASQQLPAILGEFIES